MKILSRIRFAHAPTEATLEAADGRVLWSLPDDRTQADLVWETEFEIVQSSDQAILLVIKARWSEETPETAVELRIEPDGLPTQSLTSWGRGSLIKNLIFFSGSEVER